MEELEPMPMEPWLEPVAETAPAAPAPVEKKKEVKPRGPRKAKRAESTEGAGQVKLIEFDPATLALVKQVAKAYGWSDSKVIKQAVKASLEPLVVNGKIDTDSPGVVAFWKKAIQ